MDAKIDTAQKDPHVVRSRFAYSLGAFGHDAFFALLSTYFMMYVTDHSCGTGRICRMSVLTLGYMVGYSLFLHTYLSTRICICLIT